MMFTFVINNLEISIKANSYEEAKKEFERLQRTTLK